MDRGTPGFTFFLNGHKVTLSACAPARTLLDYLREDAGLTGAKLGCGEVCRARCPPESNRTHSVDRPPPRGLSQGGCGACTVMCTRLDPGSGAVEHHAINACLAPLASVADTHITTVEGIGSMEDGVHPVVRRGDSASRGGRPASGRALAALPRCAQHRA